MTICTICGQPSQGLPWQEYKDHFDCWKADDDRRKAEYQAEKDAAPRAFCETCNAETPHREGEIKQKWGTCQAIVCMECGHANSTGKIQINESAMVGMYGYQWEIAGNVKTEEY